MKFLADNLTYPLPLSVIVDGKGEEKGTLNMLSKFYKSLQK